MELTSEFNLFVIEDAAQGVDSYYTCKDGRRLALGSIRNLATFSFHETKNISSGEGGLLAIHDEQFVHRAEILFEKGTNRASFFRGEINMDALILDLLFYHQILLLLFYGLK